MEHYLPSQATHWTGRPTAPDLPPQYWYQRVRLLDARLPDAEWPAATHALVGYACDEGVRRNQGRTGAQQGPASAREYLGKMAAHFGPDTSVVDAGDVHCTDGNMEACQQSFADLVTRLIRKGVFPIGIGGGHDIAYATYTGLRTAFPTGRIGILNFDAHFDLRSFAAGTNSGTPFRQILDRYGAATEYRVMGIQRVANTDTLFRAADKLGVTYLEQPACGSDPRYRKAALEQLRPFIEGCDHLYLTVDLDGFSAAIAPGVSAVAPVGISPEFFFPLLRVLLDSGKVRALDIAEYNPQYDRDNLTQRLLGHIVAAVVQP